MAARNHAIADYPRESCGVISGSEYVPCRNIADHGQFEIHPEDLARWFSRGISAVVHSHPDGPMHPSRMDLDQQARMDAPWGIIMVRDGFAHDPVWWGSGVPTFPLIGRQFIYGIHDCYTLVRDYYASAHGIRLPRVPPTDFEWWADDAAPDYYVDGFRAHGFLPIEPGQLRPGDGFLAQIHSKKTNHCGIYLGNGLILHHLQNALSRREPLVRWTKHVRKYLRHEELCR